MRIRCRIDVLPGFLSRLVAVSAPAGAEAAIAAASSAAAKRKTKIEERKVDGHADYIQEVRGLEPMPMTGEKPGMPYFSYSLLTST
jgi:hypothetical protein